MITLAATAAAAIAGGAGPNEWIAFMAAYLRTVTDRDLAAAGRDLIGDPLHDLGAMLGPLVRPRWIWLFRSKERREIMVDARGPGRCGAQTREQAALRGDLTVSWS